MAQPQVQTQERVFDVLSGLMRESVGDEPLKTIVQDSPWPMVGVFVGDEMVSSGQIRAIIGPDADDRSSHCLIGLTGRDGHWHVPNDAAVVVTFVGPVLTWRATNRAGVEVIVNLRVIG